MIGNRVWGDVRRRGEFLGSDAMPGASTWQDDLLVERLAEERMLKAIWTAQIGLGNQLRSGATFNGSEKCLVTLPLTRCQSSSGTS